MRVSAIVVLAALVGSSLQGCGMLAQLTNMAANLLHTSKVCHDTIRDGTHAAKVTAMTEATAQCKRRRLSDIKKESDEKKEEEDKEDDEGDKEDDKEDVDKTEGTDCEEANKKCIVAIYNATVWREAVTTCVGTVGNGTDIRGKPNETEAQLTQDIRKWWNETKAEFHTILLEAMDTAIGKLPKCDEPETISEKFDSAALMAQAQIAQPVSKSISPLFAFGGAAMVMGVAGLLVLRKSRRVSVVDTSIGKSSEVDAETDVRVPLVELDA